MQPTRHTPAPDPISIRETAESISIEITKPMRQVVEAMGDLSDVLHDFLQLYWNERFAPSDDDDVAIDELAESSKRSWWEENGDDFLRDVNREK